MFHKFSLTFLLFASALVASAQSGRIKPPETPAPTPRPRLVYLPTQTNSQILIPIPAPTPPPKIETNDDDEVIRVDSALVPIPVSVTDATGRPVTNLNIEDFELTVDGKTAEISDLFRSDAPVRLALLFDNSTSVSEAREFEKNAAVRFFRRILRPKDLAALYSVSSGTRLEQPLTKNSDQLIRAIESFPPPQGATALLDGIIKAAGYLQEVEGRRVIVIVSDGDDTVSDSTFEETIRAVQKANCQIYI
ncbi:MAG: VWA domain-containing protein, partial [Pyrinomonadaceae bacterium]|nr:VWA domain-containing protein [Pyrinomonadaceae bacterium]